jgi:hypothetical protein
MKNHWLKLYELKRKKSWKIEFYKYVVHVALHLRTIEVEDPEYTLGVLGQSQGRVSVIFPGMFVSGDTELNDFLRDVHRNNMHNYTSRIRAYQGMYEFENFELSGLAYDSLSIGFRPEDIKLNFRFRHVRHFQLI